MLFVSDGKQFIKMFTSLSSNLEDRLIIAIKYFVGTNNHNF